MSQYASLAQFYDEFTSDIPYSALADYYEEIFKSRGMAPESIVDLACGTGSLTLELAKRGYDMVGADASQEMLMQAQYKLLERELIPRPLLLCQTMEGLDLYGTVQAALCSLDGINYLPEEKLSPALDRISLFLEPGGLFIFDVISPEGFAAMDGQLSLDETEDALCLWRTELSSREGLVRHGIDLFIRRGNSWLRSSEEHYEYPHDFDKLESHLRRAGFCNIEKVTDHPIPGEGRVFFVSEKES